MKKLKVEITIPLRDNNGIPFEDVEFRKIRKTLIDKFEGLSISSEVEGFWVDKGITYNDFNKIYMVVMDDIEDNISFITGYKHWLEHQLNQKDIFILISEVDLV